MLKSLLLRKIIGRYKAPILMAFMLLFVELSLSISLPFFLGKAINNLVGGDLFQIYVFVLVYLLHLLSSTIRKWNDTRVYTKIYNNLALEIVKTERANNTDISKTIARVGLAREITDFLDRDSPFYFKAIYSILGSVFMLYWYSPKVVIICLLLLMPIVFNNMWYSKRIRKYQNNHNSQLEYQLNAIKKQEALDHFNFLRRWQIKISDLGAFNFAITEVFILAVIILSLISLRNTSFQSGDIFGVYMYVYRYATGFDFVPDIIERFNQIKDIEARLDAELFSKEKNVLIAQEPS